MDIKKYRRTKAYKSLMSSFDEWEKQVLRKPKKEIFDMAWHIYSMQLIRNMFNGDSPCALEEVTEAFAKIVWDHDKFVKNFADISCWCGIEDIYAQNEHAEYSLWEMTSELGKDMNG